jgi:hypothetical protein
VLDQLKTIQTGIDHSNPKYGAYSMHELHKGLQKEGYEVHWVTKKGQFKGEKGRHVARIVGPQHPCLLIIGRRLEQEVGMYHCITRTVIAGEPTFIDTDNYHFSENDEDALERFFAPHRQHLYSGEDTVAVRQVEGQIKLLWAIDLLLVLV